MNIFYSKNTFVYLVVPLILFFIIALIPPVYLGVNKAAGQVLESFLMILCAIQFISRIVVVSIYRRAKPVSSDMYAIVYIKFKKVRMYAAVLMALLILTLLLYPSDLNSATSGILFASYFINKFVLFFLFIFGATFVYLSEKIFRLKKLMGEQNIVPPTVTTNKAAFAAAQLEVSYKYWRHSIIFSSVLWILVTVYFGYSFIDCQRRLCGDGGGLGFAGLFIWVPLTISYIYVWIRYVSKKKQYNKM